jgi:hypothetical protein
MWKRRFKLPCTAAEEPCVAQMAAPRDRTSAFRAVPSPTPVFSPAVIDADRRTADPLARLVRAYDRAIRACEAFDAPGAHEAIGLLRSALELDSSASRSFDALYAWCEEAVDQHDFVAAAQCLRTLRDAWRRAVHPASRPAFPPFADLPLC